MRKTGLLGRLDTKGGTRAITTRIWVLVAMSMRGANEEVAKCAFVELERLGYGNKSGVK